MDRRTFTLAVLAVLVAACAPGINIRRQVPARFNLGASRRIAVLRTVGPPPAPDVLVRQLSQAVAAGKHFQLYAAMDRGLSFVIPELGRTVEVGSLRQQIDADVYLIAEVRDFREGTVEEGTSDGGVKTRAAGFATVNFQVVKSDGRVLVYQDYTQVAKAPDAKPNQPPPQVDLRERALSAVTSRFLADISPRYVTEKIELDGDGDLKPGLEAADRGDLAGAQELWRQVLQANPGHAGAVFNIGVAYEVMGEYEKAAEHYQRAGQLNPKPLYLEAQRALQRRLADWQALQQQI